MINSSDQSLEAFFGTLSSVHNADVDRTLGTNAKKRSGRQTGRDEVARHQERKGLIEFEANIIFSHQLHKMIRE